MNRKNLVNEQREAELKEQQRVLKPIHDLARIAWDRAKFATYQARMADIAAQKAYREILARMDLIAIELGEPEVDADFDAAEEREQWEAKEQIAFDDGDSRRKDELETRGKAG